MNNSQYLAIAHEKNRAEWKSADASGNTYAEPMKMVYKEHNLRSNYLNASGDERMKRDILMSEIAKLIVERTGEVVSLLNKAGFNVPQNPKQKHLVKAVVNGMHKSKRFTKEIIMLIAKGGKKKLSADGTSKDYGSIMSGASDLLNGAGNLFGGKKKAKAQAAASEAERKKLEAEAALEKIKGENALMGAVKGVGGDLGSNIGRNIAIGIGVGALLGTGIWYFGFRGK